jgi:magnesium transporter
LNPTAQLLEPEVRELIREGRFSDLREALHGIPAADTADILGELTPAEAAVAFRFLQRDDAGEVFAYLSAERQEQLITELGTDGSLRVVEAMEPDDRVRLLDELPAPVCQRIVASLSPEKRKITQAILGYPPRSVGRLMTPDYVTIRPQMTVAQALEHIRKTGRDAETVNVVYVVDEQGRLIDDVRLRQLLFADPAQTIESVMNLQFVALSADQPQDEAVRAMSRYDRIALPVTDSRGLLVGIVTVDDVADVAEAAATEQIQKLGGMEALDEPYSTIPLWRLVEKRGKWLAVLFLGELLTASAMTYFQAEIEKAAVVALFLPLIISSGGNSGSQASTLIIRAMALGEISMKDWVWVLKREAACGLILGVFLGLIGLARIHLWQWIHFANYNSNAEYVTENAHPAYNIAGLYHTIGLTVGLALIGVVLWGTLMGSMLPFMLRKIKLDPATISAPLVATLVDVTGLIIYFTTALFLLRGTIL